MHLKGFHGVFLPGILVAFLYCVSAVDEGYQCPYNIHVKKGQIIKARESVDNGATFLKHSAVYDARECYKLCCERKNCDLAQMQYRNSSSYDSFGFVQVEKICYMFHCGIPTKCRFGQHDHYATITYERSDEKLSTLDGDQYKGTPKKVNKPEWNANSHYRTSESEGESEEKDLQVGSQPQSHQEEYHNKGSEDHRYPYNSWKTHSEEENVEYSKKVKEFGKPKYHSKSMNEPTDSEEYEQPVYQKVVTKKLETPTKHVEVETKGPVMPVEKVTDKQKEMQSPTQKDVDDADAELEMKLEELTPSSEKPPHVKVTPPTTFHHWREFVDNNPNFPYTIPVNPKKTTLKPTEKQHEQPRTEHHTTEKATTRKIVRTEPHKTTERTTTTENPKPHEDKVQAQTAHAKPPILDVPLPHKNVSDVVVIETRRLRIIENKAVLPLAIFLVLAILLLFVVALRLRIVKSKLKRRPFATDDADYLINGMYL